MDFVGCPKRRRIEGVRASMNYYIQSGNQFWRQVVALWRADLAKVNPKAAESLADPAKYPNLFPDLELAVAAEKLQACSCLLGLTCA